ncbi:MAG: transglycosylase SLT domain-containing protein [Bacteriovoracaceae bacterium]|nr:transglycosylase SLT domain-containing protein [Bacteriovoracaceae bacterium]
MKFTSLLISFVYLLSITSCSTSLTRPPNEEFIKQTLQKINENKNYIIDTDLNRLEENERQLIVFLSAENFLKQNNEKAACDRFKYLGKDKTFPLAQYSLIRSLEVCDYLAIRSIVLWKGSLKEIKPHLQEIFLKNSKDLAFKKKLHEYYIRFSINYTDHIDIQKDKEEHLFKLLKYTKANKLSSLENIVNEKIYEVSPRYIRFPKVDDYLKIAKDFSRVRNFKMARFYFTKVYNSNVYKPEERIDAYERYALTHKLERQKKKFSWKIESLVSWLETQKIWLDQDTLRKKYFEMRLKMARAQWTVNFRSRAEKSLKDLINDPLVDANSTAKAYLYLGKIEAEKKNLKQAEAYYLLGLEQNIQDNETLEALSWNLGWNYYLNSEFRKSKDIFFVTSDRTDDESFKHKLTFWQAKILKKMNQQGEADLLFKDLIEKDPFGYYGIVSAMEQSLPLPKIKKNQYKIKSSPFPGLDWFVSLEKFELAEEFIREKEILYKTRSSIEEFLPLYHYAKWYEGGIFKFFTLESEDRKKLEEDHLTAAFPVPYLEDVKEIGKKTNLPPSFIYSIARQESAFNPTIRSWADAFGLLQLTPEKAKQLASRYKIAYKNYTDLYDVNKNLLLGSLLLNNLSEKYNGHFIPFVGAYNAGDRPVRSWLKNNLRKDPFEFIEMIPYKETRKYIKLVLRNLATYERLLKNQWFEKKDFFTKSLSN